MDYITFVTERRAGRVRAGIDNSTALRLIDYLPKRYQAAHHFWSWVWMLSIPGFILVAIFVRWWLGLLLLIFVTPTIMGAVKKSAAQFVLEHAEEDEAFFNMLVENGLLYFERDT